MTVDQAIDVLWHYHMEETELEPADLIFVLGSNDARVADFAAELYHRGLAPRVLFSGGVGRFTGAWSISEAETFARRAIAAGVPQDRVLIEDKATNTGENVRFSRELLRGQGLEGQVRRVIAVQKPYMLRRTRATLEVQWPEVDLQVAGPRCEFADYLTGELTRELVVNAIVGDFQRIVDYPAQGFSSPQPVGEQEKIAFETLVKAGFATQLLPGGTRYDLPG